MMCIGGPWGAIQAVVTVSNNTCAASADNNAKHNAKPTMKYFRPRASGTRPSDVWKASEEMVCVNKKTKAPAKPEDMK